MADIQSVKNLTEIILVLLLDDKLEDLKAARKKIVSCVHFTLINEIIF